MKDRNAWIEKCNHWKTSWPVMQSEYYDDSDKKLNLYTVLDAVSKYSPSDSAIVGDAGSISYAGPQAIRAKKGQRLIFSPSQADMGWALPAAIGISLAGASQVICITGDGSFMSNMQELAVIQQHKLNIKVIILNNGGYLSIKNTQQKYFDGRVHGTSRESGLWFPDFHDVATAFKMSHRNFSSIASMGSDFTDIFATDSPMILNCLCKEDQEILPAQALKNGKQAGLHDMIPFLSDDELQKEMIVKL